SLQGTARDAVMAAIDVGYRHFDCLYLQQNESDIGDALQEKMEDGAVRQEDLFIVSLALRPQRWSAFHQRSLLKEEHQKTLVALQLGSRGLYPMHWPTGFKAREELFPADGRGIIIPRDTDFLGPWEAVEGLGNAGMVKAVGVSNFNRKQIDRLLSKPVLKTQTCNDQVNYPPHLPQEELMKFCQSKGISVTAYCPLGVPNWPWSKPEDISLSDEPQIKEIALNCNKTPAQVLLWLQVQGNGRVIPKSVTPHHAEENLKV
ncbi:Aldo-keto reductase family 1 member B15, partial [Opisthocomus hoazin]